MAPAAHPRTDVMHNSRRSFGLSNVDGRCDKHVMLWAMKVTCVHLARCQQRRVHKLSHDGSSGACMCQKIV